MKVRFIIKFTHLTLVKTLYFPEYERITVLGRDDEDNIYIGGLENGLVNKIFYGCITENPFLSGMK